MIQFEGNAVVSYMEFRMGSVCAGIFRDCKLHFRYQWRSIGAVGREETLVSAQS